MSWTIILDFHLAFMDYREDGNNEVLRFTTTEDVQSLVNGTIVQLETND